MNKTTFTPLKPRRALNRRVNTRTADGLTPTPHHHPRTLTQDGWHRGTRMRCHLRQTITHRAPGVSARASNGGIFSWRSCHACFGARTISPKTHIAQRGERSCSNAQTAIARPSALRDTVAAHSAALGGAATGCGVLTARGSSSGLRRTHVAAAFAFSRFRLCSATYLVCMTFVLRRLLRFGGAILYQLRLRRQRALGHQRAGAF